MPVDFMGKLVNAKKMWKSVAFLYNTTYAVRVGVSSDVVPKGAIARLRDALASPAE